MSLHSASYQTKRHGRIDIPADREIYFPDGIYGYHDQKNWVLLRSGDSPLLELQSLVSPDIMLPVLLPWSVDHAVSLQVNTMKLRQKLRISEDNHDLTILTAFQFGEEKEQILVNMFAPICINHRLMIAAQLFNSSDHSLSTREPYSLSDLPVRIIGDFAPSVCVSNDNRSVYDQEQES